MGTFRALLCLLWFVARRFYPYLTGSLYWKWGNHMIALVLPVKQPWRTRAITSWEFTMNRYYNDNKRAHQNVYIFVVYHISIMTTSSNGNIFCVTGPLWGKSTSHQCNPLTKASDAELWYFLWFVPEQQLGKQSKRRRFETPSGSLWRPCNDEDVLYAIDHLWKRLWSSLYDIVWVCVIYSATVLALSIDVNSRLYIALRKFSPSYPG